MRSSKPGGTEWLQRQQAHEHALNLQSQQHYFIWRMTGLLAAVGVTLGILGMGVWLVRTGASAVGVAMILAATAGLVGTAVYGHQARAATAKKSGHPQPAAESGEP